MIYPHRMLQFKEQFAPTVPKEESITLKVVIIFKVELLKE